MASGVLRSVLPLLLLLSLLLHPFQHGHSFAKVKQESPAAIRERSGNALRKRAGNLGNIKLDREERILVAQISEAGERREWGAARSAFDSYTGDAAPIYAATLHAAVRCRRYQEGAKVFELCQKRCKVIHAPVYTQALRIFGKLNEPAKVEHVWVESLEKSQFDIVLASAGVAAAADLGNITGAAHILDMVNESGIPIDTGLVTSAIRACWNSSKFSDKAARYFYGLFGELDLTPTIVTFATLAGALQSAPLKDVLWVYKEMKAQQIVPNRVFAETFVASLLGGEKLDRWRDPERLAREHLRYKPPERLEAARNALNDFKSQGVELSRLCREVGKALSKLGF